MAPRKGRRRKPNTGAVRYKKGRVAPWEAAFPLGHGEYRYDSFQTRSEADAHLDRLTTERDRQESPRNVTGGSQRVEPFLIAWLAHKQPHIKTKTLHGYRYLCELASSELGALRLDEITRERADGLIAYFHRRGFQNVAQLRAVLFQAFEYALEEEYIKRNPFQRVKVPLVERRKGIALTIVQRAQLLAAAAIEDMPDVPLCPLWHLYARLGLRRGEGIGLRRTDIDGAKRTITIAQQYVSLDGATLLSTPKTRRSRRTLPLPDDLFDLLQALMADQVRRATADPAWVVSGLLFTDAHGAALTIGKLTHRWKLLRRRAGIPIQTTIHDLRHTALHVLENSGLPVSVVQAIAGHSSAAMTRHYADHASIEDMRRALGA